MKHVLRYPLALGGLGACLLFMAVARLIPPGPMVEMVRVAEIPMAAAVVVAFLPEAVKAVFLPRPDLVQILILGIVVNWLGDLFSSVWSVVWRLSGQPSWWVNSYANAFILGLSLVAAVLHLTAPGAIDGRIPRRTMVKIGWLMALAIAISSTALLRPDLTFSIEWLRPLVAGGDPSHPP